MAVAVAVGPELVAEVEVAVGQEAGVEVVEMEEEVAEVEEVVEMEEEVVVVEGEVVELELEEVVVVEVVGL